MAFEFYECSPASFEERWKEQEKDDQKEAGPQWVLEVFGLTVRALIKGHRRGTGRNGQGRDEFGWEMKRRHLSA